MKPVMWALQAFASVSASTASSAEALPAAFNKRQLLDNYQHHFDMYLKYMLLWLYWEYMGPKFGQFFMPYSKSMLVKSWPNSVPHIMAQGSMLSHVKREQEREGEGERETHVLYIGLSKPRMLSTHTYAHIHICACTHMCINICVTHTAPGGFSHRSLGVCRTHLVGALWEVPKIRGPF